MKPLPERLEKLLATLDSLERPDRIQMLIDIAGGFRRVPAEIAAPPYPADHRVPGCESEAYVWSRPRENGALDLYFAVENPQGISAMAMATILAGTVSGAPAEEIASVSPDVIYRIFGRELSMGKSMGLMGMINTVRAAANRYLQSQAHG